MAFPPASPSLADPLAAALGYVNWNYSPVIAGSQNVFTNQVAIATAVWLPFGKVCTGVVFTICIAASGTNPTGLFVGLCSPTTMLVQSSNLNATTQVTSQRKAQLPFSATYTPSPADSASGLFYVVVLQNGAYGTTQPQAARQNGQTAVNTALTGGVPMDATIGTGLTALPANGAAVTLTANGTNPNLGLAVGVY